MPGPAKPLLRSLFRRKGPPLLKVQEPGDESGTVNERVLDGVMPGGQKLHIVGRLRKGPPILLQQQTPNAFPPGRTPDFNEVFTQTYWPVPPAKLMMRGRGLQVLIGTGLGRTPGNPVGPPVLNVQAMGDTAGQVLERTATLPPRQPKMMKLHPLSNMGPPHIQQQFDPADSGGGGDNAVVSTTNLSATAGDITFNGGVALLSVSLPGVAGSITFTGGADTLTQALPAVAGSIVFTGGAALLTTSLPGVAGSIVFQGGADTLTQALPATAGSIVFQGGAALLSVSLPGVAGSIVFAGGAATLTDALAATAGSIVFQGGDATLSVTGGATNLAATAGDIVISGGAALLTLSLPATVGVLAISGSDALYTQIKRLAATAGTITFTGGYATLSGATAEGGRGPRHTEYGVQVGIVTR